LVAELLLNRHLLETILLKSKEKFTVGTDEPQFEEKLDNILEDNRFAYIRFHPKDTANILRKVSEVLTKGKLIPYVREAKPIITRRRSFQEILLHLGE